VSVYEQKFSHHRSQSIQLKGKIIQFEYLNINTCLDQKIKYYQKYYIPSVHLERPMLKIKLLVSTKWKFEVNKQEINKERQDQKLKLKDKCNVIFNKSFNIEGKTEKVCMVAQLHVDKIEYKPTKRKGSNY